MQALLSILNKYMKNTSFKLIQKLCNLYVFNIMKTVTVYIYIYIHILDGKWLKKKRKNSMSKKKKRTKTSRM